MSEKNFGEMPSYKTDIEEMERPINKTEEEIKAKKERFATVEEYEQVLEDFERRKLNWKELQAEMFKEYNVDNEGELMDNLPLEIKGRYLRKRIELRKQGETIKSREPLTEIEEGEEILKSKEVIKKIEEI